MAGGLCCSEPIPVETTSIEKQRGDSVWYSFTLDECEPAGEINRRVIRPPRRQLRVTKGFDFLKQLAAGLGDYTKEPE